MTHRAPRLHAAVVTYRRPELLDLSLGLIAEQTLLPQNVVVVDNDPDGTARLIVARHTDRLRVNYVGNGENTGPAGGWAEGTQQLLSLAADDDWIVGIDDNDPLPRHDTLGRLFEFAQLMQQRDPTTAGVALRGARFNARKARVIPIPDSELNGPTKVNSLGENFFPMYRAGVVRAMGSLRKELFFGFEGLEYGLRLTQAGFSLWVDGALWQEIQLGRAYPPDRRRRKLLITRPEERDYYALRNLLWILINLEHRGTARRVALVRGLAKPILSLPIRPKDAVTHLRANVRAIRDAQRSNLGSRPRSIGKGAPK